MLDETRLEELIPNPEIRAQVLRKQIARGRVIPQKHKGFLVLHEPVRRPVFGRPVKSMNSMIQEIMIDLDRINHPEKHRKLEKIL